MAPPAAPPDAPSDEPPGARPGEPPPEPPDAPVRYGIIGTGMMGVEHLMNVLAVPGATVVAVADPSERSRRWAVDAAGDRARLEEFADHRALLDSGLCDAVVVATPNMTHAEVLLDVLATDHHVLAEKPLCTTVADCRRVVDAAATRADRVVWMGLEYRYMPPVARLIDEVRAGAVGEVKMIAIREHRFPFLPKVHHWNRFNRNTGGTLVEKCCHFFDLMALIAASEPVRVLASGGQDVNHLDERYDGEPPDILDNALVIVEFENGARASLDLCMFAEGSENSEEVSVVGDIGKVEAFLPSSLVRIGRRDQGRPGVAEVLVGDDRVGYEGFHHGSSYLEHLGFVTAIRAGQAADVGLAEGLRSVAMGVAAHRSIDEGRAVDMAEVLAGP